jgi:hypothetical protein
MTPPSLSKNFMMCGAPLNSRLTSACSKCLSVSQQLLAHLPRHSEPLLMQDVRLRSSMKSFLISLLLSCSVYPTTAKAADDYRSRFSHPHAQIWIRSGNSTSVIIPAEDSRSSADSRSTAEIRHAFKSGSGPLITYEFMGASKHGDVYVFTVKHQRGYQIIPVVFTGDRTPVHGARDAEIVISNP